MHSCVYIQTQPIPVKGKNIMGFAENLRRKITVNQLARQVITSWGTPDNPQRMDRKAMEALLAMSTLTHRRERDLDLYFRDQAGGTPLVLVLDNELKLYNTAIEDVALRKSPTVKEMISIRNAIKILNDKDVTVSRKADTVRWLQKELIEALDLSFTPDDIDQLTRDGRSALANSYGEGIVDILTLFAELLGYVPAPRAFEIRHCRIWGALEKNPTGHLLLGPMVIFNQINNHLMLIETSVNEKDPEDIQRMNDTARGKRKADASGEAVWDMLTEKVLHMQSS
jgi:hypothetical protein